MVTTKFLREPLVQFLFIGAVLFTADHFLTLQRDDPRQIIIDADRVAWLVEIFQQGQGRLPELEEIDNLIVKWSQNEIFYREAQALGLDQGDEMMRSRLILKMRNILFNRIIQEPPSDEELKNWFELNHANYDIPPRYTFEQFPLADIKEELAATEFANTLANQPAPESVTRKLRSYPRRPATNIQALFGEKAKHELINSPIGKWQAVRSTNSWHLARITEQHPGIPADFESVKTRVSKEFQEISADMQLVEMSTEIAEKYRLHREFSHTDLQQILADAKFFKPAEITAESRSLKARAGASKEQVN
ncbi:MAG: peptidyl-prolyl cis-trans isomerase [Pseudomonadales bacterium]|nr:peptidyl-prolyl cis-trans isomerase [Pseudomonadales bacterium]